MNKENKNYILYLVYLDRWQDKYYTQHKVLYKDTLDNCINTIEIYKKQVNLLHVEISEKTWYYEKRVDGYCYIYATNFVLDKTKTRGVLEYVGK